MNLRLRRRRVRSPALASLPPAREIGPDEVVCGQCGELASRDEHGKVPYGWMPLASGPMLCWPCLRPTAEPVGQSWAYSTEQFLKRGGPR